MEKEKVGTVFTYFSKVGVAGIKLESALSVGDTISIEGHSTNFQQKVDSMQIEKESIAKAEKGQSVGIRVMDKVRPNDMVYKVKA